MGGMLSFSRKMLPCRLLQLFRQRLESQPTGAGIQAVVARLGLPQHLRIASEHCLLALALAVLPPEAEYGQRDPHLVQVVHGELAICPPHQLGQHHDVAGANAPIPARGWGLGPARGWVILPLQQSGLIPLGGHDQSISLDDRSSVAHAARDR